MRYYCENCGTEYSVTSETEAALESYRKEFKDIIGGSETKCGICQYIPNSLPSELRRLPAQETVAQWEERKRRKYPDTAPVYVLNEFHEYPDETTPWMLAHHEEGGCVSKAAFSYKTLNAKRTDYFIVATEAGAPPEDWRPE
jgi:hypothetical protein